MEESFTSLVSVGCKGSFHIVIYCLRIGTNGDLCRKFCPPWDRIDLIGEFDILKN